MSQLFPPGANWLARWSLVAVLFFVVGLTAVATALYWSPLLTRVDVAVKQPIPFSHQRHVQGNGIDCRYCHTSVEQSAFAGIPATETCMTCHSQILTQQAMFTPVLESWRSGRPIEWERVHDLPDFVYFNHSIHVNKGIGCSTCHGRIDEMRLTRKVETLHMRWCLQCHRAPEQFIRPKDEVYNMAWEPPANQLEQGKELLKQYNVQVGQLANCSICHR